MGKSTDDIVSAAAILHRAVRYCREVLAFGRDRCSVILFRMQGNVAGARVGKLPNPCTRSELHVMESSTTRGEKCVARDATAVCFTAVPSTNL